VYTEVLCMSYQGRMCESYSNSLKRAWCVKQMRRNIDCIDQ
jgi:hypothetical protein